MLDIKFIRENPDLVKQGAVNKRIKVDVDRLLSVDSELKDLTLKQEGLLADRNACSKQIPRVSGEEKEALLKKVASIKEELEAVAQKIAPVQQEFDDLMWLIPQPAREDVPVGKDDTENKVVKIWGDIPKFDFKYKDHVELGKMHDMIDIPRGVKLAGSRSYVLKNDGALLEQAVLRYTYDKLAAKGYHAMSVPVLVLEEAMYGTGYFPTGREQAYCCEKDQLALVGTAEVPLTSYYAKEVLDEKDLPIKFFAQSSCFRREAGTYGKDTQGLYRVHQFQKIEQVIIGENSREASEKYHEEILSNSEGILQDFGIPYRVVYVCTGDLGQGQLRKHDIEAWMPSRNNYGETHSCSSFHEFQARRLKLRYKGKDQKMHFCHTLNNTAIASPRILIPLIENNQNADGSITIPECLRKYMGGKEKIG